MHVDEDLAPSLEGRQQFSLAIHYTPLGTGWLAMFKICFICLVKVALRSTKV